MPLVQNVRTSTPETTAGTLPELVASSMMPTAAIMMVGSSTASISTTCARRSCRFARGNRTKGLCHVGGFGHHRKPGQRHSQGRAQHPARSRLGGLIADVVGHAV